MKQCKVIKWISQRLLPKGNENDWYLMIMFGDGGGGSYVQVGSKCLLRVLLHKSTKLSWHFSSFCQCQFSISYFICKLMDIFTILCNLPTAIHLPLGSFPLSRYELWWSLFWSISNECSRDWNLCTALSCHRMLHHFYVRMDYIEISLKK